MTRTLCLLVVASLTMACTTFRVLPQPPAAEVSGRWVGTWRAVDLMNSPREGQIDLDLAQDGGHGRGRMVWTDTAITPIPDSLKLAGAMGSPVVFAITGTSMVLRHERSARDFTIHLLVAEDEITGTLAGPSPIELKLTRIMKPGGVTTGERLGRLESDFGRERERVSALNARVNGLAIDTAAVKTTADEAADLARRAGATDATTRLDEFEKRLREGMNGHGSGNGHSPRSIVHSLDVRFGFDRFELDDKGLTALAEIVELLKENPELSAELEGYADALGSNDYNVRLSQRRVEAVHRYLARRGVPLERIHIVGLGQLPDQTPEERAKNRRVTVKLLVGEN